MKHFKLLFLALCTSVGLLAGCGDEKVEITWSIDGVKTTELYDVGDVPIYKGVPSKAKDEQYTYAFKEWVPEIKPVEKKATYVATFDYAVNKYTITFKNYDGTVLQNEEVSYGEIPWYHSGTPTKEADNQFCYEFTGWEPAISAVTKNTQYFAVYNNVPNDFKITFKNYDGTVLTEESYKYGNTPVYTGPVPTKPEDDSFTYIFDGWVEEIVPVTCEATYTAKFEAISKGKVVYFDYKGGECEGMYTSLLVQSITSSIFPRNVKKAGYNFRGWSYNGKIVVNQNGELLTTLELVDNMHFTAVYSSSALLNIVTRVQNLSDDFVGGSFSGNGEYSYHSPVTIKAVPYEGFDFVGWYYVSEDGSSEEIISTKAEYSFLMWEKDTKIEALFKAKQYKVQISSINSSLGSVRDGTNDSEGTYSHVYSSGVTLVATSHVDNVDFIGWYDENENLVSTNAVYSFVMPHNDIKLTAVWDQFQVRLEPNGGNFRNQILTYYVDGELYWQNEFGVSSSYNFPESPKKEGYVFAGWNNGYEKFNPADYIKTDTDLHAAFKSVESNAESFDLNSYHSSFDIESTETKDIYFVVNKAQTFRLYLSTNSTKFENGINVSVYNATNYNETEIKSLFVSGTSMVEIEITAENGDLFHIAAAGNTSGFRDKLIVSGSINNTISGDRSLYNYSIGEEIKINTVVERKYYTFQGWFDDNDVQYTDSSGYGIRRWDKYSNTRLHAEWVATEYNINYVLDDGILPVGAPETFTHEKVVSIVEYLPTRTGYEFDGWYLDSDFVEEVFDTSKFEEDTTVYAKWNPIMVDVILDANGGYFEDRSVTFNYCDNESNSRTVYVGEGEKLQQIETPFYYQHVFKGWYVDNNYKYDFDYELSADYDLYARWEERNNLESIENISYHDSSDYAAYQSNNGTTYYYVCDYNGLVNFYYQNSNYGTYYRTYFTVTDETTGQILLDSSTMSNSYSSVQLNLVYGNVISIKTSMYSYSASLYYYFSGSQNIPEVDVMPTIVTTYSKEVAFDSYPTYKVPQRKGYSFTGFYSSPVGGTKYTYSDGSMTAQFKFTNPVYMYAHWNLNIYRIFYDTNGGTFKNEPASTYSVESEVFLPTSEDIALDNNEFKGWYDNPDFEGDPIVSTYDKTGHLELYAKWEIIPSKLILDGNGGNFEGTIYLDYGFGEPVECIHTTDGTFSQPRTPTRSGYVFGGWFFDENFEERCYFDNTLENITTLYALWKTNASVDSYYSSKDYSSSSNYYSISNNGYKRYFALEGSGQFTMYISNSYGSSSYRTNYVIKNETTNELLYDSSTYSTSWSAKTIYGSPGDIISVATSLYSYSASMYFYFTCQSTSLPNVGVFLDDVVEFDVPYGATITVPLAKLNGYTFEGFYTEESGGDYCFYDNVTIGFTGEKTYYAHYS